MFSQRIIAVLKIKIGRDRTGISVSHVANHRICGFGKVPALKKVASHMKSIDFSVFALGWASSLTLVCSLGEEAPALSELLTVFS